MVIRSRQFRKRQALLIAGLAALCLAVAPLGAARSADQTPSANGSEIAVTLPLSGGDSAFGQGTLQGIQLAIEEANAEGSQPHIDLVTYDDKTSDDTAKDLAVKIVVSRAILMLGPANSSASLSAGPVSQAGMVSLTPTAAADSVTKNPTTFRVDFPNSEQGEMLATYLVGVLGHRQAAVVVVDSAYGHTLRTGFERAARQLKLDAQYFLFKSTEDSEQLAQQIAADASKPAIVFLTLDADAARTLTTLRHLGASGPFLGSDAVGDEGFGARLANLPEEQRQRGYFTDGMYAISPMMLDSAQAGLLDFAECFRARFGGDPPWFAASDYDAARLAAATVRAVAAGGNADPRAERRAALTFLLSLNNPTQAVPGVLGPLWFDENRGRQQAIRVGLFSQGRFNSAPLQIVPVTNPDPAEIVSGAVFEMDTGRFARLQRVVYTGMFVNEIPRVDLARSSFAADFYVWLRFAKDAGPNSPDPTHINFPSLMSGNFDRARPAVQRATTDGIEYRLWRVQGEFRNDFDLHRFPFDRQTLSLPFINARAAVDQIVYVLDKRGSGRAQNIPSTANLDKMAELSAQLAEISVPVSRAAFRNLTQWSLLGVHERRENLVTESGLGDPNRVGAESYRELSGFLIGVEMERRSMATLAKDAVATLSDDLDHVCFALFPGGPGQGKGHGGDYRCAVRRRAFDCDQLATWQYRLHACGRVRVLLPVSALRCLRSRAERLRASRRGGVAVITECWTRIAFVPAVAGTAAGAIGLSLSQSGSS